MFEDAPRPSSRPFGLPLPEHALDWFIHPGGEADLESPGRLADGSLVAANGYCALRWEAFHPFEGDASPGLARRVSALPWHRFDDLDGPAWRNLDDVRGILYRYHARPLWERTITRYHFRRGPSVTVGIAGTCQLATLQLLARLPRPEVWTDSHHDQPLFFRFKGGRAIVPAWPGLDAPTFSVLTPRRDPMRGGAFIFS